MLDILFYIFIYPIEWLMQVILHGVFAITNNYGVSIILLSIIINIIILPLYYLAEHVKQKNNNTAQQLRPKIDLLKNTFKGQEGHHYLQTLYRIYNYHPLSSVKASLGLLLQIPFFFAAFHLLGNYTAFAGVAFGFITDLSQPDQLLFGYNLLPILMTAISVAAGSLYAKSSSNSDKYQLWGLTAIFLLLLYTESSALLLYWTINNLFSLGKNWFENRFDTSKFKQLCVSLIIFPIQTIKNNTIFNFVTTDIVIQAIILFFGTIFIYKTIPMAASDTGMYLYNYNYLVLNFIFLFFIFTAFFGIIYYFLSNCISTRLRYLFTVVATFAAFSGLFYTFIIPYELKALNTLEMPMLFPYTSRTVQVFQLLMLLAALLLYFLLFEKIKKAVLFTLLLGNSLLMLQTAVKGFNPKEVDVLVDEGKYMTIEEAKKMYAFSTELNTIVIMMDMFQGNMFADIIEKYPILKQQLSGFVYYPNTLSYSSNTWGSIGGIVGGEQFQIHKIQKSPTDANIFTLLNEIFYVPNRFPSRDSAYLHNMAMAQKYDTAYAILQPPYVNCDVFKMYKNSICHKNVLPSKRLLSEKEKASRIERKNALNNDAFLGLHTTRKLVEIAFILSLPHPIKGRVRNMIVKKNDNSPAYYIAQLIQHNHLQNMADLANVSSDKKTFKLFMNNFTHWDLFVNDKCQIVDTPFYGYNALFNAGYCSIQLLNNFFTKLKQLGIYDNTKIIIVADHGTDIETKNYNLVERTHASALMLVKDFKATGDLNISMQLLSNADTYGIALSGVSKGSEAQLDRIKNPIANRSVLYVETKWLTNNIVKMFEVKNDIFNPKNWQQKRLEDIQ